MVRGLPKRIATCLGSIWVGAVAIGAGVCSAADPPSAARDVVSMGTRLRLTVYATSRSVALSASEAALAAVAETEIRISTWRSDSELERLNSSTTGSWVDLSPALARDLEIAGRWWRETGAAFDAGIASLIGAWDLRGVGRRPTFEELKRARAVAGFDLLEVAGGRARRVVDGFGIDEGGFGKGIALRDAAVAAMVAGAVCVELDFGGQLYFAGACEERTIAIADPRWRDLVVAEIPVKAGSVATSGASERFVEVGGEKVGHILDPRTGRPVPAWGSVTVIAEDPVTADCLATALYVMGPKDGFEWADRRSDFTAVFAVIEGPEILLLSTSDEVDAELNASKYQPTEADRS